MPDILHYPPVAFVIYLVLVGVVAGFGVLLAGPDKAQSALKTSTYASGEAAPPRGAATGYSPFFVIALFFAILHLGVLVIASGAVTQAMALFLAGLALVLVILILG